MINGVLVERTVKDVVPALKTNSEGLKKVLEDLVKQYNSKQQDMEKWKVCLNFRVTDSRRQQADNTLYRKRTISRLFSNEGFASGSGVLGVGKQARNSHHIPIVP